MSDTEKLIWKSLWIPATMIFLFVVGHLIASPPRATKIAGAKTQLTGFETETKEEEAARNAATLENSRRIMAAAEAAAEESIRNSRPDDCSMRGGPKIGMTKAKAVETCWGRPRDINRTITAAGETEQYVYYTGYLYFTNGILTAIQDSH